ncbi:MAG: xylulokinase [Acidobacteriota bacterium]
MIYLGIDCGTQSLKVLAWSPGRGAVASASRSYGLIEGLPAGHKEQHPSDWVSSLEECMQELGSRIALEEVRAIGVSGQQHGLVVLDEKDEVIRPAKLWNDTSTQKQCDAIMNACGGRSAYQSEIGNSLPPGFTASKILWIKEHEPRNYERIRSILLPHDYLNFYLTGEKTAENGDASGTGYFKVRERTWSAAVLKAIDPGRDLATCLPRLIGSGEPAGTIRQELATRWGLPATVKVSSGGGDNMMGAIGSGNAREGLMTISLGTSGTLYSFSAGPVVDPEGEIAAFCDSTGGWLPLGCTMNVTVATEMVRKGILQSDHAGLEEAVRAVPAGSDGLLLVPYLEGERMPSVPDGTGVLLGLRPATTTPAHLARAAMEGVTLGLRYGLERMRSLGLRTDELRLIGGGAKSATWRQMVADIFGLPVVCPESEEGPALGAAIQAMWADTGTDIRELIARHVQVDEATRHEPQTDASETYARLYDLYEKTTKALIEGPVFHLHREYLG